MIIDIKKNEEVQDALAQLDEQYRDIVVRLSQLTKEGKDTKMAHIMLMGYKPRVLLASATELDKDVRAIKTLLEEVEHELATISYGYDLDYEQQFSHQADTLLQKIKGQPSDTISVVHKIESQLNLAHTFMDQEDTNRVKSQYLELVETYKLLPPTLKEGFHKRIKVIYDWVVIQQTHTVSAPET